MRGGDHNEPKRGGPDLLGVRGAWRRDGGVLTMTPLPASLRDWPADARTDLVERAAIVMDSEHGDPAAELTPGERDMVIGMVRRAWEQQDGIAAV